MVPKKPRTALHVRSGCTPVCCTLSNRLISASLGRQVFPSPLQPFPNAFKTVTALSPNSPSSSAPRIQTLHHTSFGPTHLLSPYMTSRLQDMSEEGLSRETIGCLQGVLSQLQGQGAMSNVSGKAIVDAIASLSAIYSHNHPKDVNKGWTVMQKVSSIGDPESAQGVEVSTILARSTYFDGTQIDKAATPQWPLDKEAKFPIDYQLQESCPVTVDGRKLKYDAGLHIGGRLTERFLLYGPLGPG